MHLYHIAIAASLSVRADPCAIFGVVTAAPEQRVPAHYSDGEILSPAQRSPRCGIRRIKLFGSSSPPLRFLDADAAACVMTQWWDIELIWSTGDMYCGLENGPSPPSTVSRCEIGDSFSSRRLLLFFLPLITVYV